jgi:tetratricopeptide (TPR) repeat protein
VVTVPDLRGDAHGGAMSETTRASLLQDARAAMAGRQPLQAYGLFVEADASAPLEVSDLAMLANAAYSAGHPDITIDAWERAHAQSVRAGDARAAAGAAVRVAMHLLMDTALMAPVRGWLRRAERLLEGLEDTPAHAWLSVVHSYERLLFGDFDAARRWARQAIDLGTRHDPAAAAIGRVTEARSLMLEGRVSEGLALLDEAAVVTVSGELDPLSTGIVYCELVCALQGAAQYDLAHEWTEAMERWHHGQPVGSIHGRCRVHRAEILRLRGDCGDAEREALLACKELRPYLRRELGWPLTELGRIRLRMGDIAGAKEAFVEAHEVGWDPQPGLALVHLAEGDASLAVVSIRDALEHPLNVPSKELPPNTELRRAPLLEAQVEIEIAGGDIERARAAAEELTRVAARFESKALAAGAALARGRVALAQGSAADARHDFEEAASLWNEVGAPYETALARMGLARAYGAKGSEPRAMLELQAAKSLLERIGAKLDAGPGPTVNVQPPTPLPAANVMRREGDYWSVTFEGRTVRLRALKGLQYLAQLLAEPGREFHVIDMVAGENGPGTELRACMDSGELLDARARESYRRRIVEIDEDIEEANGLGDLTRVVRADTERELLLRELSRAVGLGGRVRRAGSASERARASVTRAIRHAIARIQPHDAALRQHLDRAVRTGTYCVYQPDSRLAAWRL